MIAFGFMRMDCLPEGWQILRQWLPQDLEQRARETGFFRRARGLQDAERWLRLILMHVSGGLSLEQTSVRARELGLAKVSAVALFKRLRQAERWLLDVTRYLLQEHQRLLGLSSNKAPAIPYQLRIIDATDVREPGNTGTNLRLHYSLQLPSLSCDHFEITDESGGEKLGRFDFREGELVLADRGYSHRAGAALVLEAGAHLVLRWNPATFPIEEARAKSFPFMAKLRRLPAGKIAHWPVWFTHGGKRRRLWLCAMRKGRLAAERSRKKALRKAQCNGTQPRQESLELTQYILVLSSLEPSVLPAKAVLELYRYRWQIELAFKRLKSLLAAGHVPKSNDASAKAWMQAKILSALLIERVILEAKFFSPWGYSLLPGEPLAALH
jgi:hypothetical protein